MCVVIDVGDLDEECLFNYFKLKDEVVVVVVKLVVC